MRLKTGIDLIEDKRIEKNLLNKNFLKRVFHPSELNYAIKNARTKKEQTKKLAGIFALKEATSKALNLASPKWLDIEIKHTDQGKPIIEMSNSLKKLNYIISTDASISHAKGLTIGIVILTR